MEGPPVADVLSVPMQVEVPEGAPSWLIELCRESEEYLRQLCQVPVVTEARSADLDPARFRRFLLQTYTGIVERFPTRWLGTLVERTGGRRNVHPALPATRRFWLANIEDERRHCVYWRAMAQVYGVAEVEFMLVDLDPVMLAFAEYVDAIVDQGELLDALTVVNYVVETGAAWVTRYAAWVEGDPTAGFIPHLEHRGGGFASRWMRAHAQGDQAHSRATVRLLQQWGKGDPEAQARIRRGVLDAFPRYQAALAAVY
jgi:hypothetical protein